MTTKIDTDILRAAQQRLKSYKSAKAAIDARITSNEQWWRMRHWGEQSIADSDRHRIMPTSAWLFNSIANKHADAMDNIPEPSVLPREKSDETAAKQLSELLPAILERCGYEKLYSDMWWYKLKNGAVCQAVMWDSEIDDGKGDIAIRNVDLLNLFWEPGITDIQDSKDLFYVFLADSGELKQQYPVLKDKTLSVDFQPTRYKTDNSNNEKAAVVDWYYKKRKGNKTLLHYCRFVGDTVLYASEDDPLCAEGFYRHGKYPFVMDSLFCEANSPVGFGYIDIMKDAQMYIDKLNQVILEHTVQLSRKRFFIKQNSAVREEEFADFSKPFVHVAGNITGEDIREIKLDPLDGAVFGALNSKIDELKETSGNRDFSQGSTSGGVTAASAIAALQEAGSKLSRDMLKSNYYALQNVCYLMIELIREFYDTPRIYRIIGGYAAYDNSLLLPKKRETIFGIEQPERKPIFDVVCRAAKKSPFSKAAQNELAKELFKLGFFNPEYADQALACIDMMDFEGKEQLQTSIKQQQKKAMEKAEENAEENTGGNI